ncbi:RND transporter [Catellatospora methionotrophica]|uniref:RND transporter n=1 Tax=Catellatospora methionotrophica TaxID=121620 RepID=A0A8J3L8I7_9ACTN|nr:efflux RND transporter periplasmic adaptor subunit [Catellatospora methionotrophica]GIG13649.1 RND transporter [Catellatospora methionotrophica]
MSRTFPARRVVLGLTVVTLPLTLAAAAVEEPDPAIVVDDVLRASLSDVINVPAQVNARNSATLRAPARGVLAQLNVEPGQLVEAGDIIGVIDSPVAQQRLARASQAAKRVKDIKKIDPASLDDLICDRRDAGNEQYNAARDQAKLIPFPQLRQQTIDQINDQQSTFNDTIDDLEDFADDVDDNLEKLDEILVGLNGVTRLLTQSALDAAQATVEALTLRAPIPGTIQLGGPESNSIISGLLADRLPQGPLATLLPGLTGLDVGAGGAGDPGVNSASEPGDPVSPGKAIVTIVDLSELSVIGQVDETDVLSVHTGDTADVSLEATPGTSYSATVTAIDILPTPAARGGVSYRTTFRLEGPLDPAPLPGMTGTAHLPLDDVSAALSVPAAALFQEAGQDFVWLVRAGKAIKQMVKAGSAGTDRREILEGLADGDRVVVSGLAQVLEGMTVE